MEDTSNKARARRRPRAQNAPPAGEAMFLGANKKGSASEVVRRKLREDIISLKLVPGTLINENRLTEQFGVSRTPVREAIQRLAEEKLVEVVPKSGTYVGRIPLSSLPEAIIARSALEAAMVRRAAQVATGSQITTLKALLEQQQEAQIASDRNAFHYADDLFHTHITRIAGYPGIWELILQVRVQIDRYRRLTLPQEGRMQRVVEEHAAIIAGIEQGNADLAAQNMTNHLMQLRIDLETFHDLRPEYFIHDLDLKNLDPTPN